MCCRLGYCWPQRDVEHRSHFDNNQGGLPMPTYISLINFTQKGAEAIKDGPKRLEAAKQRFRDAGAELKAFYLVMGQYDAVSIVEAPNDEVVAKLALGTAALGFVRSQTCKAFAEDDYKKIVASL